ncbi:MAG: DUF4351 domain-containing protein [Planctomycetota bacterium]
MSLSEEVLRYVPSFEFALDDLQQGSRPSTFAAGRSRCWACACCRRCGTAGGGARRGRVRGVAGSVARRAGAGRPIWPMRARRATSDAVVDYIFETSNLPHPVVHRVMQAQLTGETMKFRFRRRTRIAQAKAGRAEGKAEGSVEGRVELLLRQVARRFGADAAHDAESRLRAASLSELDAIAERVLDASSFDDLFDA